MQGDKASTRAHERESARSRSLESEILLFRSNKVSVSRWNSIAAALIPLIRHSFNPRLLSITLHDSLPD